MDSDEARPCPQCGTYQPDMASQLRDDAAVNPMQLFGGAIAALSLIPLAFDVEYLRVLTVVGAAVGLAILAYGYKIAFRFDPNAGDPEPRKAIGREHAVWGDDLAAIRRPKPDASHAVDPSA